MHRHPHEVNATTLNSRKCVKKLPYNQNYSTQFDDLGLILSEKKKELSKKVTHLARGVDPFFGLGWGGGGELAHFAKSQYETLRAERAAKLKIVHTCLVVCLC